MENRKLVFLVLIASSWLLFSCVSTNFNSSDWHTVTNLSELHGTWISSEGEYNYPFLIDGKKYLRYCWNKTDDTLLWKKYAESSNMDLEELWQKRFALAKYIYSATIKNENLPDSDINGTESGRKFFLSDEKIYSRVEVLIPERLVSINLAFFALRKDSSALKEQGSFYLTSEKFPDIVADDTLYFKMKDEPE